MSNKVLCYGKYVEKDYYDLYFNHVNDTVEYAFARGYDIGKAQHLVYVVTSHHIRPEQVMAIYENLH